MRFGERIVDDWILYPVFHRGRIVWATDGYRWMPNWLAHVLAWAWNPIVCWRCGHTWMREWTADDGTVECCYCLWTRCP